MKYLRSLQSRVVFKCAVVPALLLCAIFRNPALQWFAVAASALWLSVVAIGFWAEVAPKLKRHKRTTRTQRSNFYGRRSASES